MVKRSATRRHFLIVYDCKPFLSGGVGGGGGGGIALFNATESIPIKLI